MRGSGWRYINLKSVAFGLALAGMLANVYAADGCKFLLCIAGPWKSIQECRPTVYEVFRDLAKGRSLPSCAMSGSSAQASNMWVNQNTCPDMYKEFDSESGAYRDCKYPLMIDVTINNELWSSVFVDFSENSSTYLSERARKNLAPTESSSTYDNDLAAWNVFLDKNRSLYSSDNDSGGGGE